MTAMLPTATNDPAAPLPVARYSSAAQRPEDRYSAWREGSLLSFGRSYDTTPLIPFEVETVSAQLGAIGFSNARMTAQNWHRTSDHIRADDTDALMVAIRFEGASRGEANGHGFDVRPGCAVLSDFAQPQSFFAETAHTAVLAIPRQLAERTLPRVRMLHGLVLQSSSALLLRSHALAMAEAVDLGLQVGHAERLGRIALDLLEIGIAQATQFTAVSPNAAATGARLAAEMMIERKLGSATLTADNLCKWTGLSRSKLYRLFESDGGVQAYVRSRRLSCIAEDLRRGGETRLSDLAERWGFADGSHLSRLFRASFGQTPSEFRDEHGPVSRK